jgi:hypothetical protein
VKILGFPKHVGAILARSLLTAVAGVVCFVAACRPVVDIGSNVLWFADHETGDLSQWSADGRGGVSSGMGRSGVSTTQARSGRYSINLPRSSTVDVWREGVFPREAFYSAWFYLPHDFQKITSWTIMTFGSFNVDAGTRDEKTILNLRTLPSGDIVLFIFDDRLPYLQYPLAVPPAVVPVTKWFQIEVFYRSVDDDTGRMTIWIDGVEVYDVTNRPSGTPSGVYFGLGNIPDVVTPSSEILTDDAAVSLSRVTPSGVFKLNSD